MNIIKVTESEHPCDGGETSQTSRIRGKAKKPNKGNQNAFNDERTI